VRVFRHRIADAFVASRIGFAIGDSVLRRLLQRLLLQSRSDWD
jgi:hypothetical protein